MITSTIIDNKDILARFIFHSVILEYTKKRQQNKNNVFGKTHLHEDDQILFTLKVDSERVWDFYSFIHSYSLLYQ